MKGHVALVGAGPGDPELVTEKGKTLLEEADVILYDRLVHPLLLEHTRESAERLYCGKIPRGHRARQSTIQEMLVDYAREGKRVVRLKGGDPGVFAHLGEEAEELREAGVPYEIVPGLTAGLAGAAYAGIPATYRTLSTSVAFVTGHCRKEAPLSDVEIPRADTLIFYMGMHNLAYWMERLEMEGWRSETPAAVVQWGTTSKQRVLSGTIQSLATDVEEKRITNPALIIVGETARFHTHLQWYEQRPLQGSSILSVGAEDVAVQAFKQYGAHVFSYPGAHLTFHPPKLTQSLTFYQHVHFEDAASVSFFLQYWRDQHFDLRSLPVDVSGANDETETALAHHGLPSSDSKKKNTPELTVGSLNSNDLSIAGEYWQISERQSSDLKDEVFARLEEGEWINTVLFTSAREVEYFRHRLEDELADWCEDKVVVCAGKETAQALQAQNVRIDRQTDGTSTEELMSVLMARTFALT